MASTPLPGMERRLGTSFAIAQWEGQVLISDSMNACLPDTPALYTHTHARTHSHGVALRESCYYPIILSHLKGASLFLFFSPCPPEALASLTSPYKLLQCLWKLQLVLANAPAAALSQSVTESSHSCSPTKCCYLCLHTSYLSLEMHECSRAFLAVAELAQAHSLESLFLISSVNNI